MDFSAIALLVAFVVAVRVWDLPKRLAALQQELARQQAEHTQMQAEQHRLREQLAVLRNPGEARLPAALAAPSAPAPAPRPASPPPSAPAAPLPLYREPLAPVVGATAAPRPLEPVARPTPVAMPATAALGPPEPAAAPGLAGAAGPPVVPLPPQPPVPVPAPTGPDWWERVSTVLLENWTGILGAVVLVTGVGFLGIYAALRLVPPYRFLLICAFAGALLGVRFALREKTFAQQLNGWLLSSAAAIFLFACVGAVSIAGLRWATPPFDYLLLLVGVSANLLLAWRASREEVATLHGVLSLVALAVLPPTALTLGAAAGVTTFSIAITYRQQWKYQLLLSIASFFVFHLYWHQELAAVAGTLRLVAVGLVGLVGAAAAVVQYRSVYARRQFEPLLFAAHVLNWTCLGINLYTYSTGSIWKTIPLGLGTLLTFWAGREARKLGIGWLFQTDTIISLVLALATAFSLQGWHATSTVILLFMMLESLLIALIMAQQREALVCRVALSGACLAGAGLLLLASSKLAFGLPADLYRDALVMALAGWAGLAFTQLIYKQPLLQASPNEAATGSAPVEPGRWHRELLGGFAGVAGLLQAGTGLLLARVLFAWQGAPVLLLLGALVALAGISLGLAAWVRTTALAPDWIRRQQLLLGQFFAVLAVFGLHETGLSWPVVLVLLYAENLLVALLLNGRDEDGLLRLQTYLLLLQAALLPVLVRYTSPNALGPLGRAALLAGAALLTLGYLARRHFWPRTQGELAVLQLSPVLRLPALGLAIGGLLLGAGTLVYEHSWAGWAALGLVGGLLYLRRQVALPGLWAGLVLAATGYLGLQWAHVLFPPDAPTYPARFVLLYLLPTLALPLVGVATSWWPAGGRFVRQLWLYLLGLHLVVALVAAMPPGHVAYFTMGLLALAGAAFAAALGWRRRLPDAAAVARAGMPDRYLLHLSYCLLVSSLLSHLGLIMRAETFFHQPAEYVTGVLLFGLVAAMALAHPPTTAPVYSSWRRLHPWLPEAALLFGTAMLGHNVRTPWLPLLWVSVALGLGYLAANIPLRFRRLGIYGRFYYWLAAGTTCAACLLHLSPSQLLTLNWWVVTAAVVLLFGYVALALSRGNAPFVGLSPAWDVLARPPRRRLEAWLLYPAFLALSLLLIQSFDRSVLTVLLMLEVVAVFGTSLLLRRQDLRYLALAGMLGCLVRLVFFDLSQSGTITRAIVFIFMGLLLLGMNALYARFKARFAPNETEEATPDGAS